ncbi:DUF6624 domain-containing protein [Mucilaginibacter sp.]|uniref:DUF6624 domain-containing protein n=1 Tax=Mucilaginibacter sp. TaxID=1882438 RepID=UPI00284B8DF4|nr:DUF6624 domain-containing protein [Mucilaginibacter sp.]MDR3693905.1 hypothetical protein [Mucilaginibacter sp.]
MKNLIIALLICGYFSGAVSGQPIKKDTNLIKEITAMFKDDQFWRKKYMKSNKNGKSDYDAETIQKKWASSDSINELKAKAVVNKYGYPGYTLVGKSSDTFFWIIQHCDDDITFQERVLALMKTEVAKNNASKENYAYLVDRVLVNKHQKQIYGTQVRFDTVTRKSAPFPLKYPKSVNKLRKKMGLEPLEAYLKSFG